jgi:integrase
MKSGSVPDRYRALVYLLAYTGLRIGEASALRVRNVDLTTGLVDVIESSPEVGGRKVQGDTKTRKTRAIYIGPELVRILREHLTKYGRPLDPRSFVFTGDREAQVRQNAFRSRIFQPCAEGVGIDPIPTVHDLRHTAASLMAKAGYSMLEAQRALGHSSQTMTERYSHLYEDGQRARARQLDNLLANRGSKSPNTVGDLET